MIFDSLENINIKKLGRIRTIPKGSSLHRSNMMLNPLNLKHLNRLDELTADVVTLNLEDAISPSRKEEALNNIIYFLSHLKKSKSKIVIRVNPLKSGGEIEIKKLSIFKNISIRVPKVREKEEITKALSLLPEDGELHISLETKEAFRDLDKWGDIDRRFTTANLGILDLLADLNLPQSLLDINNPTIDYILSHFLISAHTASLLPVSFMFQDYKDTESFKKWCEKERFMGFESKACMGPAQVEIANKIFASDDKELNRAKEIVRAFEESSKNGINGFMHQDYGFIDEPIYRDALNILKKDKNGTD